MKKLIYLFAAAALLTACSSDELSGNEGATTPDTEQTVSSLTVGLTNGTSISVGNLGAATSTRAGEGSVNFNIDLSKLQENDSIKCVLDDFAAYKLKADDFAIRLDGKYVDEIKPENNNYQYEKVLMSSGEDLCVAVRNLETLDFTAHDDYTFEFYLWIENKMLDTENGTGGYSELFTDEIKKDWICKSWPVADGEETGVDFSKAIWDIYKEKNYQFFETGAKDCGLLVRYNLYRGLQGYDGNTPYIKVSVHVEKKDQTTANSEKNECTWVHIPYTAK